MERFAVLVSESSGGGIDTEVTVDSYAEPTAARAAAIAVRSSWTLAPGSGYYCVAVIDTVTSRVVYALDSLAAIPTGAEVRAASCPACGRWVGAGRTDRPVILRCRYCDIQVTVPSESP